MTSTLFTPKNLSNNDIWLVKYIGLDELSVVQISIWESSDGIKKTTVYIFGSEVDYDINEFEFIRKIEIPELEK